MKKMVKAECESCDGTGIYRGMAEGPGVGVVCLTCNGTGCEEIEYTPFTARKKRRDVKTVHRSRGKFIVTGIGPAGMSVSYEEFLAGKMPKAH